MALTPEPHSSVSRCASLAAPESARAPSRVFHNNRTSGPGWLQLPDSSTGRELGRTSGSWEDGARADVTWRGVLSPGEMVSVGVVELSTGPLVAVPAGVSPKAHNPMSPCVIPVYREPQPLLRDPAGANRSVCTSHLRGHPGTQQSPVPPWWMESRVIFTARCYVGSSSQHCAPGGGV